MVSETLEGLRARLSAVNEEISVVTPFRSSGCRAGLVAFRPRPRLQDEKWVTHEKEEVICHVLEGCGWLRLKEAKTALSPGTICHIPARTAHDFVAQGEQSLLMFYVTVAG